MDSVLRFASVLGLVFTLSACASGRQHTGRIIDTSRIPDVQVGTSTKADVLRLFGPPTYYSRLPPVPLFGPAGEVLWWSGAYEEDPPDVFVYEYRQDSERFFTVLLYTRFMRQVRSDVLVVFFDDDDVVSYVSFARQTDASEPAPQ
jgi:hypothetical protein